MNQEILNILSRLEQFRKDINTGKIQAGTEDWIIRMCQAKVAQGYFDNRIEWKKEIS